ncbi:MAG: molybdopterin molybdotransferase MoeA [Mogibacterium sp.]|nr:molybdopterin molybdotransferase MoeA [Mogibacterium sp.]
MNKEITKPLQLEEVIRLIQDQTDIITDSEKCTLDDVRGRILAEDIIAPHDQPPFPRSPFDGYAVRSRDTEGAGQETPVVLEVIGEVDAGGWFGETVAPGQAVRIMTGAPIPEGADAVIKQEETDYGEDRVRIYREMRDHQNYIFAGEDYRQGSVLLEKGEYIGPVEVGILASAGICEVFVQRKPRAVVISTGDEIIYPGQPLTAGKIYDSNLYTIVNQLKDWNVDVIAAMHSSDRAEQAEEMIRRYANAADLIVTSGGVSVGKKDIMHEVFSMLGIDRIFWKVGMKPGAAVLAGKFGNTVILSLSGNPYAAYVDLHMIVRPTLSRLTGNNRLEMIRGTAVLANGYDRKSPVRRFIRAFVQDGKAYIDGHTGGNGDISSGRHMNAMIDVPSGSGELMAGAEVNVILL